MAYKTIIVKGDGSYLQALNEHEADFFKKRKIEGHEDESDEDSISKKARKAHIWSQPATEKLLQFLKVNKKRLHDKRKRKSIWKEIWLELNVMENTITVEQVEKKWRNMMQSYKKYCELKRSGSKVRMKEPEYLEDIDEIMTTNGFCGFDFPEPEIALKVTNPRTLEKVDIDLEGNLFNESQLISESDVHVHVHEGGGEEEEAAGSPELKSEERKKKHKRRPPTRSESVEISIQQLVETNKYALQVDRERLRFLENQVLQQGRFDEEFLNAFKERNDVIKKNSKVFEEFRNMFREHLRLIQGIESSAKKIEKFLEEKYSADSD